MKTTKELDTPQLSFWFFPLDQNWLFFSFFAKLTWKHVLVRIKNRPAKFVTVTVSRPIRWHYLEIASVCFLVLFFFFFQHTSQSFSVSVAVSWAAFFLLKKYRHIFSTILFDFLCYLFGTYLQLVPNTYPMLNFSLTSIFIHTFSKFFA